MTEKPPVDSDRFKTISTTAPIQGQIHDVSSDGMSAPSLNVAAGSASTSDPKFYEGDGVFVLNVPAGNASRTLDDVISTGRLLLDEELSNPTAGSFGTVAFDWATTAVSEAIGTDGPTLSDPSNNTFFIAVAWRKMDSVNGPYLTPELINPPISYIGKNVARMAPAPAQGTVTAISTVKSDVQSDGQDGRALLFRRVPAKTPRDGHRLVDGCGEPLRASRIAIHAFDIRWCYTNLAHTPHAKQYVRRAIGDTLEVSSGPYFLSPHNSLIIWQGDWATRRRTVVISESRFAPDIIELDPTKDIYVQVNYHRVKPLKICGHFSLSVTLDP